MKYMMMMHHRGQGPYAMMQWSKQDIEAHIRFMKDFVAQLQRDGEFVAAEGLAPPEQAKLVRTESTDGVFPETKEFLVGFWIVDVESPERAYALAAKASAAPGRDGAPMNIPIEVRQVMSAPT